MVCSSVEEGSGDGLTHAMDCSTSCDDGGMVLISEYVTAGMNYSCTVTATNNFSSQQGTQRDTNHVLAILGQYHTAVDTFEPQAVYMHFLAIKLV